MKGTRFLGIGISLAACVLAVLLSVGVGFISVASAKPPVTYPASLTFRGSDMIKGDESQYYKDGEILRGLPEVVVKIYSGGADSRLEAILGKTPPLPPNFERESGGRRVFLGLNDALVTDSAFKAALSAKLIQPQSPENGKFVAHLSIRIYRDLLQIAVGKTIYTDATVHFMVDGLTQEYVQSLPGGSERTFELTPCDNLHVLFHLDFGSGGFKVTRTSKSTWNIATVSGSATVYVQEYLPSGLTRVDLSGDSLPYGFTINKL